MAKLNKALYTKEEFKKLQEKKKEAKELNRLRKIKNKYKEIDHNENNEQYNVLCLKHGDKYNADYVNKLYNMVRYNLSLPFSFWCLTENPTGIHQDVRIIPLPKHLQVKGWWYKPYIFSNTLPIEGTILYLDLDLVIANPIDKLFLFYPNKYCVLRDFTRSMRPGWPKYNSSVIRFDAGQLDYVWQKFQNESQYIMKRHYGDQDFLYEMTNGKGQYFPDTWIKSWKWEVRKDRQFRPGDTRGNRRFAKIENVEPPADCCIVVFHGDPNPHNCQDPFIIKKWV